MSKYEDPRLDPRQIPLLRLLAQQAGPYKPKAFAQITRTHAELVKMANSEVREPVLKMIETHLCQDNKAYQRLAPSLGIEVKDGYFESLFDKTIVNYSFVRPECFSSQTLPCVYYIHGGGMVQGTIFYAHYRMWARLLAHQGLAVFMVDFRNALIPGLIGGAHSTGQVCPYPGGLMKKISYV
jgi:acetyl esterase